MKIRFDRPECETPEDRKILARIAANTMGNNNPSFLPYKTNEWDDSFWVIDEPNDWRIKFLGPDSLEVVSRYAGVAAVDDAADSLTRWLAYRLGGTLEE